MIDEVVTVVRPAASLPGQHVGGSGSWWRWAAITHVDDRTYGGTVVSATYRELFAAVAAASAALTACRQQRRQLQLVVLLVLIFGTELIAGIVLVAHPDSSTSAQVIGYALVASLLVGVARSWELVGEGILVSSLQS